MRHIILVLAVTLVAASSQARADMVTYNMTGTITRASLGDGSYLPFTVGDHITWTLQYDRFTPLYNSNEYYSGYQNYYMTKYPAITNIVDHTNGYHFPWPSGGGGLLLYGDSTKYPSSLSAGGGYSDGQWVRGEYDLFLVYKESFPTSNLSDWQMNSIPLNLPQSDFSYYVQSDMQPIMSFDASVDSMSGPMAGISAAPEPSSLMLFLLGAAGLATRGLRRHLGRVG